MGISPSNHVDEKELRPVDAPFSFPALLPVPNQTIGIGSGHPFKGFGSRSVWVGIF